MWALACSLVGGVRAAYYPSNCATVEVPSFNLIVYVLGKMVST